MIAGIPLEKLNGPFEIAAAIDKQIERNVAAQKNAEDFAEYEAVVIAADMNHILTELLRKERVAYFELQYRELEKMWHKEFRKIPWWDFRAFRFFLKDKDEWIEMMRADLEAEAKKKVEELSGV